MVAVCLDALKKPSWKKSELDKKLELKCERLETNCDKIERILKMSIVTKKVINRCRRALDMDDVDVEVRVKIDDSFFTATFAEGETISLSE